MDSPCSPGSLESILDKYWVLYSWGAFRSICRVFLSRSFQPACSLLVFLDPVGTKFSLWWNFFLLTSHRPQIFRRPPPWFLLLFLFFLFLLLSSAFIPFQPRLLALAPLRNPRTVDQRAKLIWGDLGKCKRKVEKTNWESIVQYKTPPPVLVESSSDFPRYLHIWFSIISGLR